MDKDEQSKHIQHGYEAALAKTVDKHLAKIVELEARVKELEKALQTILDMPCPFTRDGDPLGEAQKIASGILSKPV